jgi:2-haloacid dehalogenase
VLASVVRDFAAEFKFPVSGTESAGLAESIRDWQPFPDTVPGLKKLHTRYKLAIPSNIDDDLFALTTKHLQVPLDLVVTAQQAQAYKPSRGNFELLLRRLGTGPDKLLHVAESLYHDVVPAREMGIATVWVNRRQGRAASATKLADAKPDLEVASIAELAELALR